MDTTPDVRIRAITLYDAEASLPTLEKAASFFSAAREIFKSSGCEVQSCRVATVSPDVHSLSDRLPLLEKKLEEMDVVMCFGPITDTAAARTVLKETRRIFLNIPMEEGVESARLLELADFILAIASEEGVGGSFRFCVTANCPPFIPYFPAAYVFPAMPSSFAVAVETSGILHKMEESMDVGDIEETLLELLTPVMKSIELSCRKIAQVTRREFLHVDCSLCPRMETPPMTELWKRCGIPNFGDSGTLSVCSAITNALKRVPVSLGGFNGLMLPVCEDAGLVEAARKETFTMSDLLYYSTVCACGLDCVPVPGYGDLPEENDHMKQRIAQYLRDLHSIAYKHGPRHLRV